MDFRTLQSADYYQSQSEPSESVLYLEALSALLAGLIASWGGWLWAGGSRGWGILVATLSVWLFLSFFTAVTFGDPLFWRVGWSLLRGRNPYSESEHSEYRQLFQHDGENVSQIPLVLAIGADYPSPIQAITIGRRYAAMKMDHVWHTRVTVTCITIAAIFDAGEEALSHSPHIAEKFSDIGWIHYAPLALLIIAGISWLTGRLRTPEQLSESEVAKTISEVKLHGGKALMLGYMEARAIELQSQLEALWHHWNNAKENLIHPLDGRLDTMKDSSSDEYWNLINERRDFMVLYAHHLGTLKAELPEFTSAAVSAGYPAGIEYHQVLTNLKSHAEKLKNESLEVWDKY